MAKSDHIERKIKEGFESVEHKAPESVWSVINENLDNNSQGIDEKVKSSFENKDSVAPHRIWEGIEKQLTIDRGWAKVHTLLQRITFYKWTKRAAAIFIFLFFVTPELNPIITNKEDVNLGESKNELQQKEKEQITSQTEETSIKIASSSKIKSGESNSDHENSAISNIEQSLINSDAHNDPGVTQSKTENANYQNGLIKEDDKVKSLEEELLSITSIDEQNDSDLLIINMLPIKNVNSRPSENQYLELIDLKEKIQNKSKFEFGLYTAINSTAIMNNATRRALDAKSLVAFNSSFGTNLGFQFVYHFDTKHSLASAVMHSSVSQSYNKFSKGSLNEEVLNVNFVRLQTLYQYKHKLHPSQKSAFTIKAGPYLGHMTTSNYLVNDELIAESLDSFKDFDFGVTFQAGHSIDWNKLVLDYGLNIDKGLTNLNIGKGQLPALFDRTTVLGLGAYVSLRWKL
jgi:hypothetical protein